MAKLTQDDLLNIFHKLKKEVSKYEKGSVKAKFNIEGKYDLWSGKEGVTHGKKRDELPFAALIVQSSYVGFYFSPIYTDPELLEDIAAGLRKTLKGKSCFHIKKDDAELMKEVRDALKKGYEHYKAKGWV